jgi:opacity protein-like surface antigen
MKKLLATATVLALAAAAPATAAQVTLAYNAGASTLGNVQVSYNSGSNYSTVGAGRLAFTKTAGNLPGLSDSTIYTFCIEPQEYVQNVTIYNVVGLQNGNTAQGGIGNTKADAIAQLLARFRPVIKGAITTQAAQALQIAIWEIVRETSGVWNVGQGLARFQSASASGALTLAQSYLDALTANGPRLGNIVGLSAFGAQDQLAQVPEPAMLGLFGLGALGLFAARRRKKKA